MSDIIGIMLTYKRYQKKRLSTVLFSGTGTFTHGVHPPQNKAYSENEAIEIIPPPEKVVLPLLQHIGGPCVPLVTPGQEVFFGEMIGKGEVYVSTSLHAPLSGTVEKSRMTTLANGRHLKAIVIRTRGEQLSGQALWDALYGGSWPQKTYQGLKPEEISLAIHEGGIVGLGGAAFPTHVKISPSEKKPIHTLMVNGCECEPYLTTDYRLMVEAPEAVVTGAQLAMRAVCARDAIIGVENNKLEAVAALRRAAAGAGIKIAVLQTKYPQGSEKHLIKAVLDLEVPLGGLPLDIGVAMTNVGTVASVAGAVMRRRPLTHRIISVTGGGIVQPRNLLVPLGISMGEVLDFCGGLRPTAARIIAGGPMMGFAFNDREMPVTKGTSGITVLTHEEIRMAETATCIRCGRCVDVCPMQLVPTKIAAACIHKDLNLARRYHIQACFECGSCAYICPAGLALVQQIRAGKALLAAEAKR